MVKFYDKNINLDIYPNTYTICSEYHFPGK